MTKLKTEDNIMSKLMKKAGSSTVETLVITGILLVTGIVMVTTFLNNAEKNASESQDKINAAVDAANGKTPTTKP